MVRNGALLNAQPNCAKMIPFFNTDNACKSLVAGQTPMIDVPMIVSLHVGTSIKSEWLPVLVATDKMDAAMEIGAEESPTKFCSHEKVTPKLSFFLMWWTHQDQKIILVMIKSIPVPATGISKVIGFLVPINLVTECSLLEVKDQPMATIVMNSCLDHLNGLLRWVPKSLFLIIEAHWWLISYKYLCEPI